MISRAVSKSLWFNFMLYKNKCRFNIKYSSSLFPYVYFYAAIECADGTYGYACLNNCSGHCLNGSICNKPTGHCDEGCSPGYTNRDCSRGVISELCQSLLTCGIFYEICIHNLPVGPTYNDFKTTLLWSNNLFNILKNLI